MNRDDIIRMAREAGIIVIGEAVWELCALVAAAERSACAEICEVIRGKDMQPAWDTAAAHCAAAIRARGEK